MDKNILNKNNLDNFVNYHLKPALCRLESKRKKLLMLSFFLSVLIIFVCIVIAKLVNIDGKSLGALVFTSILPYLLITEKYKLDIQKKVMKLFNQYFENLKFVEDECIPDYKLIKSNLFKFTQNISEIGFCGTINNQKSIISLPKLLLTNKETGKSETTFVGIATMTLLNQYSDSQVTIVNNADVEFFEGLARIKDETLFIFSNDADSAKTLITTEFKDWFLDLNTTFNTEKYAVTFFDNTALIAIYTENLKCFNYKSIYQKIEYTENMSQMYKYIIKLLELNFLFPTQPELDKKI